MRSRLVVAVAGCLAGLGIGFLANILTGAPIWYLAAPVGALVGVASASRRKAARSPAAGRRHAP